MTERAVELDLLLAACAAEADAALDGSRPLDRLVDAQAIWEQALAHMVLVQASDLHLKAGSRPRVRILGQLLPAPLPVLSAGDCDAIAALTLPALQAEQFAFDHEADYVLDVEAVGRLRINAFRERGGAALAIRRVAAAIPSAAALGLLPSVQRLASHTTGLCVVAGRAGSGKTTTLAWIIDRINDTRDANVITIEDPIHYLHADRRSIIHQRQVGADTGSYAEGLRRALRQDPDVIVVGELRDEETARTALVAAQTGHLVLTTLPTDTAGETIDGLVELFSPAARHQARRSLAATLRAVVCQRLVSRASDRRRILVQEVLLATDRIAPRIIDPAGAGRSIGDRFAQDEHPGMVSFDQHLLALHQAGTLSRDDVLSAATDPHHLGRRLDPPEI